MKKSKIDILNYCKSKRLLININHNNKILTLLNIYAPNNENEKNDFFMKIITWICQNARNLDNIILCGDFNCQFYEDNNDKGVSTFKKILKMMDLNDCW